MLVRLEDLDQCFSLGMTGGLLMRQEALLHVGKAWCCVVPSKGPDGSARSVSAARNGITWSY